MVTLELRDGDYLPDGKGGVRRLKGAQALVQRVLFRLRGRRGAFPLLPEVGSDLFRLLREKPAAQEALARSYVERALEPEEVSVREVLLSRTGEHTATLTVWLDWQGETLVVETPLG